MKNDSIMTTPMDLAEENDLHTEDVDDEKEFDDRSCYTNDFGEEPEAKDNVNTQVMEWPLRHNSETEKFPFACNGFRRAKTPRYTCTGRITRVPSRYLDTDSDSSDGRKAVVPRLKVKRRRKSSSSNNKLLVNGYKEHADAFSLKMASMHSDRIIYNLNEEMESLANLECPEVFEEASPVSGDTISHITSHETQARTVFQANNTLSQTANDPESLLKLKVNGVLAPNFDYVSEIGLKEASMCCSQTSTGGCVISAENKRQPCFASSILSTGQAFEDIACDKQTSGEFEVKESLCNWTEISNACTLNAHLNNKESCDSSTKATFVSSMQISKQSKVSCASWEGNDSKNSQQKGASSSSCLETVTKSAVDGCFPSEIVTDKETCSRNKNLDLVIGDAILSVTCLENREELPEKQLVDGEKTNCSRREDCIKPQGLNCFRNFKMGRGYARKLNKKQMRRTDRTNGNNGLKKQTLLDQIKHKPLNKVKKTFKPQKNNFKQKNKKDVQKNAKFAKTSDDFQELDRVLGMRRKPMGDYEFLVQWANGTSCWVSSDQVVTNKHNCILRQYFMENSQDISVINRVPFQAYCCDSLSLDECQPVLDVFKKRKELVDKCKPTVTKCSKEKREVLVENEGDHCYITLNRETCKRKLTCLKILNEFIAALEDASVGDCHLVVIKGLGSRVFSGLNIDGVCKVNAEEKGNIILQKTRYLVQTLSNYPKPLVGLISRPARGVGAVFLSLFDMICDEEAWKKDEVIANSGQSCESVERYCLPRVVGHSIPCEEILMGKNCNSVKPSETISSSAVPDTVFDDSDNSNVLNTLKEIETTIHKLGKKTTSFMDMSGEEIFKMAINQVTNFVNVSGCASLDESLSEQDSWILNGTPSENSFAGGSLTQSTGSAPADRYVKELETKIIEEKQLVQKYFEEISNIWKGPSTALSEHC